MVYVFYSKVERYDYIGWIHHCKSSFSRNLWNAHLLLKRVWSIPWFKWHDNKVRESLRLDSPCSVSTFVLISNFPVCTALMYIFEDCGLQKQTRANQHAWNDVRETTVCSHGCNSQEILPWRDHCTKILLSVVLLELVKLGLFYDERRAIDVGKR